MMPSREPQPGRQIGLPGETDSRWDAIWQLVLRAEQLPAGERGAFLQSADTDPFIIRQAAAILEGSESLATAVSLPLAPEERFIPQAGMKIGRYRVGTLLGSGGSGSVYAAFDVELNRPVAIKFVSSRRSGNSDAPALPLREARAASALNHPNTIMIHEVIETSETAAIVMELVKGVTLREAARRGPSLDEVLRWTTQLAHALAVAHDHGLIHGDIKPENVMVRDDGYVKLLDFGLALDAQPLEARRSQLAGTLRYLAPERCLGQPPSQAGDVFAFGVVLYELTTGRYPYESENTLALLQAITESDAPRPSTFRPDLPAALDHLIPAMLARPAEQRPTAGQVADRLAEAAQKTPRRSITDWLAFAAVIAVVTVLAAAYWFRKPPVSEPVQLAARPITSYPGDEIGTAFSPDGTRIAFAWRHETDKRFYSVYTRALDGGEPTPLTTRDGHHPAWSPSGKEIAFLGDVGGRDSIFVVPAEGGVPRELVSTNAQHYNLWPDLAWSGDSKWIAYSGQDKDNGAKSIYGIDHETRAVRKLTQPKDGEEHIEPALSQDGKLLAFTVDRDGISTIAIVKFKHAMLPGGETQQVRFPQLANTICSNPVWNPANGELLFTASNGASLNWLWSAKVDTDGRSTSLRLIGNLGDGAKMLAISPTGNHLAFTKHISSETLRLVDLAEGSSGAWQTVLASTYRKSWPRFSPDGKRIAFESDRAGFMDVWLANADGSGAFALTNFNGPVTGSPAWSPDGRQIAFDSRASGEPQVYTIRAEKGAQPKSITTGNGNFLPAWSADGHFLYFVSNRTGDATIWRVPAEGGAAVQISRDFGFAPQASLDGKYLYFFAARSQHAPIHRLDLATLKEEPLIEDAMDRSISVTRRGIYFLQRHPDETTVTLKLFEPVLNRESALRTFSESMNGGLEVRKDDRAALVMSNEFRSTDLMLIEDFQ